MSEGIAILLVSIILAVLIWVFPEEGKQIGKRFGRGRKKAKLKALRRKTALAIVLAKPSSLIIYLLRSVLLMLAFIGILLALWGVFLMIDTKSVTVLLQAFLAYVGGLSLYVFCIWRAYLRGRRRRFSSLSKLEKQKMTIVSSLKVI